MSNVCFYENIKNVVVASISSIGYWIVLVTALYGTVCCRSNAPPCSVAV